MNESATYGYARVSSMDQNLSRQLDAFSKFGLLPERVFCDRASGKDFEHPQYKRLIRRLREGDLVVVKSIDRLGRNYDEIIEEWRRITKVKGADIVVLDMPLLDTREKPDPALVDLPPIYRGLRPTLQLGKRTLPLLIPL